MGGGGGNLAAYAPLAQHNDAGGFRAHAAGLGFWVMVRKTFGTTGAERGAAGAVTSTERAKRSEV